MSLYVYTYMSVGILHICQYVGRHVRIYLCLYLHTHIYLSHRGGLRQFISHICALGILLQQQK